ncbi:hypothetical protein YC2023_059677 [Brassica napus]
MEESSLLEMFCSDSSLFASTQGRRFEKGFWYLEYLQHVFESRGFQFSDSDHAVGDSVESCKDDDKWAKEIDGNHSSGDSNEAGTKLGVHNINANSGFPETVDLVFYMDKNEKACDLRDISLEERSKVGDSELCNDLKTNRDVEESSREDFADAEGFDLGPNPRPNRISPVRHVDLAFVLKFVSCNRISPVRHVDLALY